MAVLSRPHRSIRWWSEEGPSLCAHVHFTPTSTRELETAIRRYIDITNERPKLFRWTKTADEILASVERFVVEPLIQDTSFR
jgi:hypothetical protein